MSTPSATDSIVPFARTPLPQNSLWHLGWLITILASGKETRGRFMLAEASSSPGNEPPPHTHLREDETFYILEGAMSFQVGGQTIKAGAGASVFLPRGIRHASKIESQRVRALVLVAPAGLEGFFEELSEPAQSLTIPPPPKDVDLKKVLAVSDQYGIVYE